MERDRTSRVSPSRVARLSGAGAILLALLSLSCGERKSAPEGGPSTAAPPAAPVRSLALQEAAPAAEAAKADEGGQESPPASEVKTWRRAEILPNTSRLMIGDKEELPLAGLQANVRIDGFRARVVLDCYYFNDRDRQFEGTFKLRLPNEASPDSFAFGETAFKGPELAAAKPVFFEPEIVREMGFTPRRIIEDRKDSWTNVKEARMVPREKAAFAYTETVRRRVDPALMEWSGAGVFSARVFPLAPKKLHRIVIGYDVDLLAAGDALEYRLDTPSEVPECAIDIDVAELEGVEISIAPDAPASRASGRCRYHFRDPVDRTIAVRLEKAGPVLLTGADEKTGPYFAARFRPEVPAEAGSGGSPRAIFLADISLSANPDRLNVWLKLLEAILDKNRGALDEFAVLFFNIESFWWRDGFAKNTPENAKDLLAFARGLALEGATDLEGALAEASSPAWRGADPNAGKIRPDLFLLSDGAGTWGEGDLHALSRILAEGGAGPLFAYVTGFEGIDSRALAHLARASGGAVFSVVGEAEVPRAAIAHRAHPLRIQDIRIEGASDILIAGRPQAIFPGQTMLIAGRGTPKAGVEVVLTLAADPGKRETWSIVKTKLVHAVASESAPRLYGQVAVGQLEEFQAATETFSKAYATHFRVTAQTCSLLMLESEEDYLRFGIKPEEDAFIVKRNPVAPIIAKALADIAQALGDPKAAFLAWLDKMGKIPGVAFEVPAAFRLALPSIPAEAFAVRAAPIACKLRTWQGVPGEIQEQLASKDLDYDALAKEAERRRAELSPADALKALSSLVENDPGDAVLARDVGFSAMELGLGGHAYHLFRRVAASRPYEPQTYRAMAGLLDDLERGDLALAWYEVCLAGTWPDRFGAFRRIAGLDYLRFLRRAAGGERQTSVADYAAARLETIGKEFLIGEPDLLVTITWNTDGTDIDLHVIEPTGEECYYSHNRTKIGGELTEDVTQGYGPEMYVLRKAVAGTYKIRVRYYSEDRNRASARTKVYATIYERWGAKDEKVTRRVVTLIEGKEFQDIAGVAWK
ncbi:MAG: hypothetical protein JXP34_18055 [Planctomycetes bacterium]|nr:hypothetical protein [Planctomycetota bacterium]